MSSASFANKLFNKLDKGLTTEVMEPIELKQVEVSFNGKSVYLCIDEDYLYFCLYNTRNKINRLDLNTGEITYNYKETSNTITGGGFAINGEDVFYHRGSIIYKNNNVSLSNANYIFNINSDKILGCASDDWKLTLGDLNSSSWTKTNIDNITSTTSINNKYFITDPAGIEGLRIGEINNKDNFTDYTNIQTGMGSAVFCNDTIFGYIDDNKICILPVAEYEKATDKASLTWTEVVSFTSWKKHCLSNKWYVNADIDNNIIYYGPALWLYTPEHLGPVSKTQMDLLYDIDKKLDLLQDLLKQFTVPTS